MFRIRILHLKNLNFLGKMERRLPTRIICDQRVARGSLIEPAPGHGSNSV